MLTPRPYQTEAVEAVYRYWENALGRGNPLVIAPTGAGKSVIIALLIARSADIAPGVRIICLADVKELIEQNAAAYGRTGLTAAYGIYSASIGRREATQNITFAQIQSVRTRAGLFGHIDFVIVDEAHMVNTVRAGMYRSFIEDLKQANPSLKTVGFTATPYRLGAGYVYDNAKDPLFCGIAYDIPIERLIADGYLVPPVARAGTVQADTSRIEHGPSGEFREESATAEFGRIAAAAVEDMVNRLQDRRSILVFACSLHHADEICDHLRRNGEESVRLVTGSTPRQEREEIISAIRARAVRWLINVGVLTKGFDAPNIDAVVLLRATESAALYVQMVGRGLRPCEGKAECAVLDYGRNVMRHGPINDVRPRGRGERKNAGRVMAKECAHCRTLIALNAKTCPACGREQPAPERQPGHDTTPSELQLLGQRETARWHKVMAMTVTRHVKHAAEATRQSMKVSYQISFAEWVNEFICPEHGGIAEQRARQWFEARGYSMMGVDTALTKVYPVPENILVDFAGKFPSVKEVHFGANFLNPG